MQDAPERMNETRTCTTADAKLTQDRSDFVLEDARRFIIAERVVDGADTPLGHRYSNMVELIENYRAAGSAFQVSHIKAALVRTVAEIAEIKGRRALPAPAKMLSANQ